jgi:hypothetical protein
MPREPKPGHAAHEPDRPTDPLQAAEHRQTELAAKIKKAKRRAEQAHAQAKELRNALDGDHPD